MNTYSILIIHGFAGSIEEVFPLATYFNEKGYQTRLVKLHGHQGSRKELAKSSYSQWLNSVREEYAILKKTSKNIIVIGFSMGGLLAINLHKELNFNAVISICTPIKYWNLKIIFQNLLSDFKHKSPTYLKKYLNSATIPFRSLLNFRILLYKTQKCIHLIDVPIFIAHSALDDTAHYKSANFIYENTISTIKQLIFYPNSEHKICLGVERNQLFYDIEKFIKYI